ncbi:MAG: hypothetical protein KJ795_02145 [Gammaproteobacteria bacterium]|nr:hypothetical protein [Gammaproteobacteria bacterium]MBU1775892.1 hypothetical protein [Gammaproteobacteria bacterium]
MEARLVKLLLRCVQSDNERFSMSASLDAFVRDYGPRVGERKGKSIYMTPTQKLVIRELLDSEGVNADTPPDAWDKLTRTEALAVGHNEKFAQGPVRRRRVAIKALRPSLPLFLNGLPLLLPARCHVEVDHAELVDIAHHDWLVVVENWECFNDIHVAADSLAFPGQNPLIIWRGDKDSVRSDSMLAMLHNLKQPVAAFVDYDPSGMVIARSLPRLKMVVAPPLDELAEMMLSGLTERYMSQIAGCSAVLEKVDVACVSAVWDVIRLSGRALPQESFVKITK